MEEHGLLDVSQDCAQLITHGPLSLVSRIISTCNNLFGFPTYKSHGEYGNIYFEYQYKGTSITLFSTSVSNTTHKVGLLIESRNSSIRNTIIEKLKHMIHTELQDEILFKSVYTPNDG